MQRRSAGYARVTEKGADGASSGTGRMSAEESRAARRAARAEAKRARALAAKVWSTRIHALLWVLASAAVIILSDFFTTIATHDDIRPVWLDIGLATLGANLCIVFYLAVWAPCVRGIKEDPQVFAPRLIAFAAFLGGVSTISLLVALWPVWGFLTPFMLGTLFIGSLMITHFLPSW